MATVRASGGDYTTLNGALVAAESTIVCDDAFTDTTAATVGADCTITGSGDGRHAGVIDVGNHYTLSVSGAHALTLNGAFTATIDGIAIRQNGTGSSDEGFRCVPGTSDTVTIKECLIWCANNATQQDCIYTGFNTTGGVGTINVIQSMLQGANRAGIHSQNGYTAAAGSQTINVNACFIARCGLGGSNAHGSRSGGIYVGRNAGGDRSGITINVHNTAALENDTGNAAAEDYNDDDPATNPPTWNVSYSIDSDGSIATDTGGGTGNLASRTITDSDSPGAGDWVIVENSTTAPWDLRLKDNAENDAQDAHATATAHGLTIPSTDIVGMSRPQNYDIGPYEISAGGAAIDAAAGSYALTGQSAELLHGHTLTADQGSYTLTGQDASLIRGLQIIAESGEYTLTGQAAALLVDRLLAAAQGGYALTGSDAVLLTAAALAADQGAYTVTGPTADLLRGLLLSADSGSYAVSGQDATLLRGQLLNANPGAYPLTGQAASLLRGLTVDAETGAYSLTGIDADLVTAGTLTADQGGYSLTGIDAALLVGRVLNAETGAYTLTGQDAGLIAGARLAADTGSYVLTGLDAALLASEKLLAETGSHILTGQAVGLLQGHRLTTVQGEYTLTGNAASLSTGLRVLAESGAYSLAGQSANLLISYVLDAESGAYAYTGQDANLVAGIIPVVEWVSPSFRTVERYSFRAVARYSFRSH